MTKQTKIRAGASASKPGKSLAEATDTQHGKTNKPVESEPPANTGTPRPHSKSARLLGLLRSGTGASLEDMCDATGWQAHSVRAALTGLRKRGHVIQRHMEGTTTVWRSVEPAAAEVPA